MVSTLLWRSPLDSGSVWLSVDLPVKGRTLTSKKYVVVYTLKSHFIARTKIFCFAGRINPEGVKACCSGSILATT